MNDTPQKKPRIKWIKLLFCADRETASLNWFRLKYY